MSVRDSAHGRIPLSNVGADRFALVASARDLADDQVLAFGLERVATTAFVTTDTARSSTDETGRSE